MNETREQARHLIQVARQAADNGSIGQRLGESILFMAQAATATHVTVLGGNPASRKPAEGAES